MKNLLTPQLEIWKWSTVCPVVAKHLNILKFQFIFWITMQRSLKLIQTSSDQATQLYNYWPLIHNKFIFYLTLTVWTVLFFYSLLFFRESVFNSWSTCKTRKRVHEWTTCIDIFYQYFLIKKLEIQCGKPETSFSGPKTKFVSSFFLYFLWFLWRNDMEHNNNFERIMGFHECWCRNFHQKK